MERFNGADGKYSLHSMMQLRIGVADSFAFSFQVQYSVCSALRRTHHLFSPTQESPGISPVTLASWCARRQLRNERCHVGL